MRNLLCRSISLVALCAAFAQPAYAQAGGVNASGRLQSGDRTLESGEYYDTYNMEVREGQRLDIRLNSSEFDPYLLVRGPGDVRFENDDEGAGSTNARINEIAPVSGNYRISATSYQAGETGNYRIQASAQGGSNSGRNNGGGNNRPTPANGGGLNTSGRLQSGDGTLDSGEFADRYEVQARAGQQLDIRLTSTEFDTYLMVRGPGNTSWDNDDAEGEQGTNARINEVAPADGTYRITATSYEPGDTGNYRLTASVAGGGNGGGNNSGGGQAAGRHNGTLANGDSVLNSGEFSDAYIINGRAGQQVEISLNSSDFDTYVMLRGPDGSSFDNDDAEGQSGTNSRLNVTLPANGSYRLVVTSYTSGETGGYTLETRGATSVAEASTGGSGFGGAAAGSTLASGVPVNGRLSEEDNALDSGEFFDVYTLAGEPGTQFVVEMQSSAVDTYLAALGAGGYEVTNDDDASGNNGTNSRMDVTIPDSGTLTIAATSYAGGETGTYTLVARQAGFASRNIDTSSGRRLALGQNVSGNLAAGEETFMLTVSEAGPVRIALSSDDFDPMLRIEGQNGFNAENDDDPNGGSLNSLLEANLPGPGTYRVVVTSYSEGGTGSFQLAANTGSGSGGSGGGGVVAGTTLALGREVRGSLANNDETLGSGEFIDTYSFEGRRGQRVTFDLASEEFDTYLSFLFPGGGSEENDDRAGGDGSTDSHLTVTLPDDGVYQLVATSYQPGVTGSYTLSATTALASDVSANPARPNSRVFALSVGVADYERIGGLSMTDQDALKLTQALSATGMLADESVTLVNAQATRENFQAAVQQISANIGPDDLFLIFFSGHGAKNDVDRSIERDGSSETIELFDTALADYELDEMIAPISARTLLVLDSCFSGGFDGVINSRIGRMGVFSSDSDVTSLVADKFEAGGYISHILQLAVEGRADANRDAAITAGELSEYMRNTFYQIALAEPLESSFHGAGGSSGTGYQHIVVNRGGDGMPYEDVLVNLAPSGG